PARSKPSAAEMPSSSPAVVTMATRPARSALMVTPGCALPGQPIHTTWPAAVQAMTGSEPQCPLDTCPRQATSMVKPGQPKDESRMNGKRTTTLLISTLAFVLLAAADLRPL